MGGLRRTTHSTLYMTTTLVAMASLSDSELHACVVHPDGPTARAFRSGGNAVARVRDLVAFVQERLSHPDADEVEAALDAYIERQGGGRLESIDLDDVLPRLWAKVRGKPSAPPDVYYEIPKRLFAESGAQQRNVTLPPASPNG